MTPAIPTATESNERRLHCPTPLRSNSSITLEEGPKHYLLNVLRLRVGSRLHLFNAKDGEWLAEITKVGASSVQLQVLERIARQSESPLRIHLGQVMARGKRTDWTVQKCTELGVTEVWPLLSARCQVRGNKQTLTVKQKRWQEIANESARQCLRTTPPRVRMPRPLTDYLEQHQCDVRLVMHESDSPTTKLIDDIIQPIASKSIDGFSLALLVGPEGGFSPAEIELISSQYGFYPWLLGPRLLRTETAAPAALAILQYLYGDLKR